MKVRQIAQLVDLDVTRVKSKLRELGIIFNSNETEISAADVERLFKHIGFNPAGDEKETEKQEEKAETGASSSGSAPEGVIRRVRRVEYSEPVSQPSKTSKNRGGVAGTADSNLRSGFVTVTDGSRYDDMDARARKAKEKAEQDKKTDRTAAQAQEQDAASTSAAGTAERPRIRRRAANPGASSTAATAASAAAPTGTAAASGTPETSATASSGSPVKTAPEGEKTPTGTAPADGKKTEEATVTPAEQDAKEGTATAKTDAGAASETSAAPSDAQNAGDSKPAADAQTATEGGEAAGAKDDAKKPQTDGAAQPSQGAAQTPQGTAGTQQRGQGTVRRRPASEIQQRDGKNGQDAGRNARDGRGTDNRGAGASRDGRTDGRTDGRDRDQSARQGRPGQDQKNTGRGDQTRPQGGQFRPSRPTGGAASSQPVSTTPGRRDSGRDKDFAKNEKRNEGGRKSGGYSGGQQKEGKYNDARRMIGEKGFVSDVESDEFSYNNNYIDSYRPGQKKNPKPNKKKNAADEAARIAAQRLTNVKIPPVLTVAEFAALIKKSATEIVGTLFKNGIMATQNQEIDYDTAAIIADGYGITAEPEIIVSNEEILIEDPEDKEVVGDEAERPPVVVVMGHVDHGKTSLLDAIRNTSVTAGEAGGITQHIGAYTVTINDHKITFLDTPGHEAFTAMRARGAQVTDVAIIVVAADDGVMPQTIEAINHAKAANVSIVVAVNKIDKEGANVDRVKQEMAEQGIVCEEWGGEVPFVPVSAKKGVNIDMLLETVILSADILQLKASPSKQCKGTVIEAKLDKNKGPVATLLVQRGTLRAGDAILTETTFGHIRRMTDDKGRTIKEAGPSTPVEVTGLSEVPEAGKIFYVVNKDERLAKKVAEERIAKNRESTMSYSNKVTLEDLFDQIKAGEVKNLDIIVKADVKGSVEAIKSSLEKLSNEEVHVRVIHGAVGGISESDVLLAEASNAVIIGFNVRPIGNVGEMAKERGVDVKLYRVIYDAIDDVKAAMAGMLKPEFKENVIGNVEIRKIFKISGVGTVAGAYVRSGKVIRNSEARIVRDGIVIYEGKLASLKRVKDDVKEVAAGYECGLSFEKFDDLKEGDVIEIFVMEQVERKLD